MTKSKWPTDAEKEQGLNLSFEEGEYRHERARNIYAAAMGELYAVAEMITE